MPRTRDLLARFRPAGTPGAAAARGVPADRVAEAAAELEPVLARLARTEEEARALREEGRLEAERRRHRAEEHARALLAEARREAEAERADAAARVARETEAEASATHAAAREEAEAVLRRAAERMPGYVDRVVAAVREAVAGERG